MKKRGEAEVMGNTVLEKVAEVERTCGGDQIKGLVCGAHLRYTEPEWLWQSWTHHFYLSHILLLSLQVIKNVLFLKRRRGFLLTGKVDYKPVCNPFATTYYMTDYKTIYMYYLKKSHDSLNRSYD